MDGAHRSQDVSLIAAFAENGDQWCSRIAAHHQLGDGGAKLAKQLCTAMLLSEQHYPRWLDKHAVSQRNKVRQVQDLGRQAKQFRDAMFNDPEYKNMLEAEAQALQRESPDDSEERRKRRLWSLWLQEHEDVVLRLIVSSLRRRGFDVRADVFDGCMVEHRDGYSLADALRTVEEELQQEGWAIRLDEKKLYGLQDDPLETVELARQACDAVKDLGAAAMSPGPPATAPAAPAARGAKRAREPLHHRA